MKKPQDENIMTASATQVVIKKKKKEESNHSCKI